MSTKCLIACAVFDTDDNKRTDYTIATYYSLIHTIDLETTRVIFINNGSCEKTKKFLSQIEKNNFSVITNKENRGTAFAINQALKTREKDEFAIKMDNDVKILDYGWVKKMIRCFENDPNLGILGLKRTDIPNMPGSSEFPSKELKFLPHKKGDYWNIIETCDDIIGTCTMYSPKLLDKVGYLYQPGLYGFDDVIMCSRSILSGFYNAFYPSIDIIHLDDGKNPFTEWKRNYAGLYLSKIEGIIEEYRNGTRPLYYNPFE